MKKCLCQDENERPEAYTVNDGGSNNGGPYINFCPDFFRLPSLKAVVDGVPNFSRLDRFDVEMWQNKGIPLYRARFEDSLTYIESGSIYA